MTSQADPANVIRGHKAAVANPFVSEAAKENSRREIERPSGDPSTEISSEEGESSHVIGGYKATLSNERTSDEAKANARVKLAELGVDEYEGTDRPDTRSDEVEVVADEYTNRQLGGYKAALKNPNVSKEAKDEAVDKLNAAGVNA